MNQNAVYRLIAQGPRSSDPPNYWYFGDFADDEAHLCAEECLRQNGCKAFTLHLSGIGMGWRNQCYGRGAQTTTMEAVDNIVSGVKTCVS